MPKVSVIIPTYNRAKYICESVNSALQQTFDDLEVIVVDDGSTDDTSTLLERFRSDDRFKYHFQTNQGRSSARNLGIDTAQGEWIVFLDSDDQLVPNAVETFLKYSAENPEADVIIGRAEFFDDDGKTIRGPYAENVGKVARGFIKKAYLRALRDVFFSPGSYMVRADLIRANGIHFDTSYSAAEDLDFAFRLAAHGSLFDTTDIVQRYRFHGTNTSKTEVRRTAIEVARKHLVEVVPKFPVEEQKPAIARLYLNIGDNYFLLNDNPNAFSYYLASLKYDPGVVFESNVIRQIVSSSIPSGLLKYFRYLRRGEMEN
jgi:glycosyltransferase involved in cell wall biosynthesis